MVAGATDRPAQPLSWLRQAMRPRALAAALVVVLATLLVVAITGVILGRIEALAAAGGVVAVAAVAALAWYAATGLARARRSGGRDVDVLRRSVQLLGRSPDPRRVADEAVRAAANLLIEDARGPVAAAVLVEVTGDDATVLAAGGEAAARIAPDHRLARGQLHPEALEVLRDGRPRFVPAADPFACIRDASDPGGDGAWAVARVDVGGDPFGLLAVAPAHQAGFRDDDLRLLAGIADISGLAIGSARRQAELGNARQRLRQSVELALETGRSLEPEEMMDRLLARLAASMEADQAALLRIEGETLVVEATHRSSAGRTTPDRRRFPYEHIGRIPQLERALVAGEPAIGGPLEAAGPGAEELARALPTGARTLILPYAVDGRTVRVFAFGRDGGRPFEPADLARLTPMADVAVLALGNAVRHAAEEAADAASGHSGRLAQAIEAAEEIGAGEELEDVVERARLLAVHALRADRGNISRLEGDELVVEHDHRPMLPYARRRPLARSRMGAEAIRTRRPVHGRVAEAVGPDGTAWMVPAGIQHAISCPLIVGGEVVGLLGLGRERDEPFTDADGEALQPIAKLVGLMLQNARRLAEARQTGQIKSQFVALAAHELRTPLAVIRGYLSLLEDGTYPVPERTRAEAVETLVAKAQELESLVESLVMAARLESRAFPHAATELDMGHEVREAVDRVRPRARLESALVTVRMPGGQHRAMADRSHVGLILNNLLNNALTYSAVPAEVTVELRSAGEVVEVAVQDRGHGIPKDQHGRVFERFHRVNVGPARTAAGLGLGLTISQELAHLNGGELVLERSAPGEGSVFVLRLHQRA